MGENYTPMKDKTTIQVQNIVDTLNAEYYDIRLIDQNKLLPALKFKVDADRLIKSIGYYKARNREGYDIYFRPLGYEYVFLDDLTKDNLPKLAELKPCLLIESSPKNYHAWLKLSYIPRDREEAVHICRELAILLNADKASAEPDHVGRLAGFTNRKTKHRQSNGLYPYVILHKFEDRVSSFSPDREFVAQRPATNKTNTYSQTKSNDTDRSREDFNLCCMLIRQGKPDSYIREQLELISDKAKEIKPSWDYVGKTIRNAHKALNR
jgi:hypothetical protein